MWGTFKKRGCRIAPFLMIKFINVRLTGIEPAHREILDPKSSASANSATGAKSGAKVRKNCVNKLIN